MSMHPPAMYPPAYPPFPPPTTGSSRLGLAGLWLAIVAAVGTVVASAVTGAGFWPMQESTGSVGGPSNRIFALLLLSHMLWGTLGILGLVFGILGLRKPGRRGAGIGAIVVACLAPLVSLALFVGLLIVTAP